MYGAYLFNMLTKFLLTEMLEMKFPAKSGIV